MKFPPTILSLLLLPALLGGCASVPKVSEEAVAPSGVGSVSETASGQSAVLRYDELTRRMDFWLGLTTPATDGSEGPVVFSAHGFSLSQLDYETGLKGFLAGRARTEELEAAYRANLGDQLLILRWLEESGTAGTAGFRVEARRALRERLALLTIEKKTPATAVGEEEVQRLYNERIARYRRPEMVEVRMIQVATPEDGDRIMGRLSRGESFGTLAATESKHESRMRLGELEPFARGAYNKDFEELAFSLAPGDTGRVNTNAGTFVIQKIANIPGTSIPLDQVRDELRRELQEKRMKESMEEFLRGVR